MRHKYENRAKRLMERRKFRRKVAVLLIILSVLVCAATMYSLKQPAIAVSENAVEEVGMVMDEENSSEAENGSDDESIEEGSTEGDIEEESSEKDSSDDASKESSEEAEHEYISEEGTNSAGSDSVSVDDAEKETKNFKLTKDEGNSVSDDDISSDKGVSGNSAVESAVSVNSVSNDDAEYNSASDNEVSENSAVSGNSTSENAVSENEVSENAVSDNQVKKVYVYEDEKIKVTASLENEEAIPAGAEFVVTELTSDTKGYNYDAYIDALNSKAEDIATISGNEAKSEYNEKNTLMYDIAFIKDGQEVQPTEGAVNIVAEFKKNQLKNDLAAEEKEDINVVHLPIKEDVKESENITLTEEATSISSNDIEVKSLIDAKTDIDETEKVEFSEETFSVYAFCNESKIWCLTSTGNLRIHKMVVNDFGSSFVRNGTKSGSGMLSNVTFRITDNFRKKYIVFTGFTDVEHGRVRNGAALEYDLYTHQITGSYNVEYNNNAQWTVFDLPSGVYQVEEVADGLTLKYDVKKNKVIPIEKSGYSRITKYDLTVDDEESSNYKFGAGGINYRKVYSKDLCSHEDLGPDNVYVGNVFVGNSSHTETVQVCNYYSTPLAPISVNKCFSGGKWGDKDIFTFKVEAVGAYDTYLSDGKTSVEIPADKMPMPENTTISVTKKDAVVDSNGNYSAEANFGYVYYTYEGTYKYKVTEIQGNDKSIVYDKNEYYIYVKVSKQYTKFKKEYKTSKIANFSRNYYGGKPWASYIYSDDGGLIYATEDFYYLGADEVYEDSNGKALGECTLRLGENPKTACVQDNPYIYKYNYGNPITFNNTRSASLEVKKIWLDSNGEQENEKHMTPLVLEVWCKSEGSSEWRKYIPLGKSSVYTIELSSQNKWKAKIKDLPLYAPDGKRYVYSIKEDEIYQKTHSVTYEYAGKTYSSDQAPGYEMKLDSKKNSYGCVTIRNKSEVSYVLPETGGIGDNPFRTIGLIFMAAAIARIVYHLIFKKTNPTS